MKESKYLNGLDSNNKKSINKFPIPWQRNFLYRFYEQLKKQNATKKTVTEKIKEITKKPSLLPRNYELPQNTLSQFTNYESKNIREISVTNLIAISLALDVSINYLLGIDECETPENTNINKATGLTNEAIEAIKSNKKLQEKLNFFLLSSELNKISKEIDQLFLNRLVFNDILSAYSKRLYIKIESAYKKFFSETFALDRTEEKYKDYLYQELPLEKMKFNNTTNSIMYYVKTNVSSDVYTQIQLQLENYSKFDEQDIYHVFIDIVADFTYDIFERRYADEIRMNSISQSVTNIINDYIQSRIETTHKKLEQKNH